MHQTEQFAKDVYSEMKGAGFGAPDWTSILKFVQEIIALFSGCSLSPANAVKRISDPGRLGELRMLRSAKKAYPQDPEALAAAASDVARRKVTAAKMKAMMAENEE